MEEKHKKIGVSQLLIYFAVFFLVSGSIAFSILYSIEIKLRSSRLEEVKTHENQTIALELEMLGHEFRMIVADLNYLSSVYSENIEEGVRIDKLTDNWCEFSYQRGIYDQIRFIDARGNEQIRVNLENGQSYSVAKDKLQNKSDRYYFTDTIVLPAGSVYVSALDLNIENNVVEVPYKPIVRFCSPIYDDSGKLQGIIVLNYLAGNLLENFRRIADYSSGEMSLLTSNGDWLSSPERRYDWNFMFDSRKHLNFGWYFAEWELVKEGSGQEITQNGLFTYYSIDMSKKALSETVPLAGELKMADDTFRIVSLVSRSEENHMIFYDEFGPLSWNILKNYIVLFVSLFIIALLIGALLYLYIKSYRKTKIYSRYDSLTNVLNSRAGVQRLSDILNKNERRKYLISLCFIDVNGLKQVNDILGHKMGDELIITVANVIKNAIREEDFIVRVGGDEFIIMFSGIDAILSEAVWTRINLMFEKINREENRSYEISVSHGIVTHDNSMEPIGAEELIKKADAVMYEEKRQMKQGLDVIRVKNSSN